MLLEGLSYLQRLGLLAPACLLGSLLVYACRRLPPGAARLAAALPVLALHCSAPLAFQRVDPSRPHNSEIITVVLVEFALVWLANYKLIAWACGRGPLCRDWTWPQFTAILLAPIAPVDDGASAWKRSPRLQAEHAVGPGALLLAAAIKAVLLVAGMVAVMTLPLPQLAVEFLYTFGLYVILSSIMDGPAALFSALLRVPVAPHFDCPWAAASLADFWARRWDVVASNALRVVVYDPIREGHLVRSAAAPPRRATRGAAAAADAQLRARRAWGVAACFGASGLMHEVQFVYMTGHTSGGLMLAFFCAQVPLMALEAQLGGLLRRLGWQPPVALKSVATLLTLQLLAHRTFWHACRQHGITDASLASLLDLGAAAKAALLK